MRRLTRPAIWLLALLLLLTACTQSGSSVAFVTLAQGDQSAVPREEILLFTEARAWEAHWQRHAGTQPASPRPPVDFGAESVLAIYIGEKPATGYAVEITRIESFEEKLRLFVKATHPARPKGSDKSSPFHIVKVPKIPRSTVLEIIWR